jgi:hypothetical protein
MNENVDLVVARASSAWIIGKMPMPRATARNTNFFRFAGFSKTFFGRDVRTRLREGLAGCLFEACSELPPPMIIGP